MTPLCTGSASNGSGRLPFIPGRTRHNVPLPLPRKYATGSLAGVENPVIRHGRSEVHARPEIIHFTPGSKLRSERAQHRHKGPCQARRGPFHVCRHELGPPMSKVGIPNFVSGPRENIMEGEYVILAMCSWLRISWFRIICWHCWRASGNKWIMYVDLLRPLKNHGLIVFILTYTPWLLCHGFAFWESWVCRWVIRCGTVDEV